MSQQSACLPNSDEAFLEFTAPAESDYHNEWEEFVDEVCDEEEYQPTEEDYDDYALYLSETRDDESYMEAMNDYYLELKAAGEVD